MELPFPPLERVVETLVPPDEDGRTLLDYLTERFDYLAREQWSLQIAEGNLKINGQLAANDTPLHANDLVFFQAGGLFEQDVSFDIAILDETDDYLIVNKPGDLPCHPAGRFFNHTLWAWLKQAHGLKSIHFVSRLDRETSGCVLIGKTPRFAAKASKIIHSLGVEAHKKYLVVVHGRAPETPFTANGWLMKDPHSPVEKKKCFRPIRNDGDSDVIELPEDDEAVTAQTDFELVNYCRLTHDNEKPPKFVPADDGEFSLLEATLHTGRTHQIRATLCSLGFPVVGDKLYGVDDTIFLRFAANALQEEDRKRLILPTQALHAWKLAIPRLHIDVTAKPPWIP